MGWVPPFRTVKLPDCQQNFESLAALLATTGNSPSSASFPSNPKDGQIAPFNAGGNVTWLFIFSSATGRWHFIGGPPLFAEVTTGQALVGNNNTYVDLATAGPSITIPLAGDYTISGGCVASAGASANVFHMASVKRGAAATADVDFIYQNTGTSGAVFGYVHQGSRTFKMASLTASEVLKVQYKDAGGVNSADPTFANRWLSVIPESVTA